MTMVDAQTILALVPQLRRYARALTGSQKRGDAYVRLCLETILAEPARLGGHASKLGLFRAFHDAWKAINRREFDSKADQHELPQRVDHGLAELPALERQVLLLTALEGFPLTETAAILGQDLPQTRELLAKAQRSLRLEISVPIMIIEDEPLIAMDLARIVGEMGHVVCGTAARQDQAIEMATTKRPSLILADIQLRDDDSGIVAVQDILKSINVPIIFVTGFPERLLTGENIEPAFVMTKPFNPEVLKMFISQALSVLPLPVGRSQDVA